MPQGSIAFISKGWVGHVSDIHLTENCSLLKHLLPGDAVLADQGFNIQEAAGMYCAEVEILLFRNKYIRYESKKRLRIVS